MTEREKMLAGQLYDCGDAELLTQWHKAKDLARDYNRTDSADVEEKERILSALLGGKGKNFFTLLQKSESICHDFSRENPHIRKICA